MSILHNAFLGGSMFMPLFDADKGGAAGGGDGGAAPGGGDAGAAAAAAAAAAAPGAAAAAAAAAPGAEKTLAGGGDAGAGAAAAAAVAAAAAGTAGKLPDGFDFRGYLAAGDKDAEKDLAKYTDPRAVYKTLRELQTKISKGELKAPAQPLPANATDEQKAEWRKANGLPETPAGYVEKLTLPKGMVLGAADKPLVEGFAKAVFDQGGSQAELDRAVAWYYERQDQVAQEQVAVDGDFRVESQVALKTEWGSDFKPNMNAFGAFKALIPSEVQDMLFAARTPDGKLLGDHPAFLKIGAQIGRELNPSATLMPTGDNGGVQSIDSELKTIEGKMYINGQRNPEYWGDEKIQARYRDLLDAKTKMGERGGKAA